jgi:NADH:ubiquinone oxidoreductase subunit 3 (subunit A)
MVVFDKLYTYEKPRNRRMFYIDSLMKFFILSGIGIVAIWVASEILFKGVFLGQDLSFLRITNPQAPGNDISGNANALYNPVPVHLAYVGLGVGFLGGAVMYIVPILTNFILAPPGGKLRVKVVDDDQFAETTYECGEDPIGSGHGQVNLQYYSFALVFIMFDIITALTLMFALVFSLGQGTTGTLTFGSVVFTPTTNDVIIQIVAILLFITSPLLVLGFWLKKKAILWQ